MSLENNREAQTHNARFRKMTALPRVDNFLYFRGASSR